MTSRGPLWPQESVMWSSQLLALLEKREKKREGRNRGAGQSCCTFMFAVPSLRFLGPQAVCVGGAEQRLGGHSAPAAGSGDGRLLALPSPCSGGGWLGQNSSLFG